MIFDFHLTPVVFDFVRDSAIATFHIVISFVLPWFIFVIRPTDY